MPQIIRTFLRKHQADINGGELQNILEGLPNSTPVYQHQDLSHIERTIHTLNCDKTEFCVFTEVPGNFLDHDKGKKLGRIKFYPNVAVAIIKIPSKKHCAAERKFDVLIHNKVQEMGLDPDTELLLLGSGETFHKQPDASYRPLHLPSGRSPEWPSIVLEVAWSQTHASLRRVAHGWLQRSQGDVRSVVTIKISRTLCTVQRYIRTSNGNIQVPQTITIRRNRENRSRIIGGPLVIPFDHLLLRQPTAGERDIVLYDADLRKIAWQVWAHFD